jgi:hypothetical protein
LLDLLRAMWRWSPLGLPLGLRSELSFDGKVKRTVCLLCSEMRCSFSILFSVCL